MIYKVHVYEPAIMAVVEVVAGGESEALEEALRVVGSQTGKKEKYWYLSPEWQDPDCGRIARIPGNESIPTTVNSAFESKQTSSPSSK